jgi:hypothetical protein
MTNADYRDMASEIRDLIPLLVHPQAVADIRLLADRYERLARYLEVVEGRVPGTPLEFRRQAS